MLKIHSNTKTTSEYPNGVIVCCNPKHYMCETNNKHNTPKYYNTYVCYVYIIAHFYGSESYNHEKVNFRLFKHTKGIK